MARILITIRGLIDTPGLPYATLLRDAGHEPVPAQFDGQFLTEDELRAQLPGIVATLASSEPYTRDIFEEFPELRVVSRCGVGYDAVDLEAAREHGVPVMIAAGSNAETVAETTVALMLALAHDLGGFFDRVAQGDWSRPLRTELAYKTVGIVGLGRIGRAVAERLQGFGVKIVAAEKYPDPQFLAAHGIELLEIDEVFRRADFITLHTPLNDETRHLVNARRLALMKPTAYLTNTARGGLVDEDALYAALTQGTIAGAALDVFAKEPPTDLRLPRLSNVLAMPHVAGLSHEALVRMSDMAAQSIVDVLDGAWDRSKVVNGVYSE